MIDSIAIVLVITFAMGLSYGMGYRKGVADGIRRFPNVLWEVRIHAAEQVAIIWTAVRAYVADPEQRRQADKALAVWTTNFTQRPER